MHEKRLLLEDKSGAEELRSLRYGSWLEEFGEDGRTENQPRIAMVKRDTVDHLELESECFFLNITLWLQPVPTILYFLGDATTYNNVYNRKVDILACDMNILGN